LGGCVRYLVTLVGLLLAVAANACPKAIFTDDYLVRLTQNNLVIVTHASTKWDSKKSAKQGIDQLVYNSKAKQIPIVYLQHTSNSKSYYYGDCQPNYYVNSSGGNFNFDFKAQNIYLAGGHLGLCQDETVSDIVTYWGTNYPKLDLNLSIVTDATYMLNTYVRSRDPYYQKYKKHLKNVGSRRISLATMIKIIEEKDLVIEFLRRYMSARVYTWYHSVNLAYQGEHIETHYDMGNNAPVITINFTPSTNLN